MYSLCVLHLSDLIVFIYQVWVGNRMRVFPVISLLSIQQNVLSLNTTAGNESDMVAVRECVKSQESEVKAWLFLPIFHLSQRNICKNSALIYCNIKVLRDQSIIC